METTLFWIFWGIISFWTIKTFYYSSSKQQLERLRKTALGIQLGVLVLTLLPWLPPALGEKSGLTLALEGNVLAVVFLIAIITSVTFFLTKTSLHLKIASGLTMVNTLVLFVLMTQLRPGTFTLSLFDIAPIIATIMLLVGDVVVLLLWQQLQLLEQKSKSSARQTNSFITIAIILLALLAGGWMVVNPLKTPLSNQDNRITTAAQLDEVVEFKKAVEENGRSTFHMELEDFGSAPEQLTVVRVFEVFPDHQTTFNRYRVNTDGTVSRYDGVADTWEQLP